MMKAVMTYPSPDEEARMLAMLTRRGSDMIGPDTITGERISVSDVDFLRKAARRVHVSDAIMRYAVDITATSRGAGSRPIKGLSSLVRLGASPRATIALTRIGQAKALLSGRDYVVPEDLKAFAHEVLRHRIMLTFEALADGVVSDQIVDKIVETVLFREFRFRSQEDRGPWHSAEPATVRKALARWRANTHPGVAAAAAMRWMCMPMSQATNPVLSIGRPAPAKAAPWWSSASACRRHGSGC